MVLSKKTMNDHLGSTRLSYTATIDATDKITYNVMTMRDNLPFGRTWREYVNGKNDRFQFTGYELDGESGLNNALARMYDPELRFGSVDPHFMSYPNWSPYVYSMANPIRFFDPTGKDPETYDIDKQGKITKIDDQKYYNENGVEVDKLQSDKLASIEPSSDDIMFYRPCQVQLTDGRILQNVYIVEMESYYKTWGVWPGADPNKKYFLIEDVESITDSPNRLPASFANKIYLSGETGMGYNVFEVIFKNSVRKRFVTGNGVDFIQYPPGLSHADVIDVVPKENTSEIDIDGPEYYWCIYSE
ncbi:MAG: RHS repeat-associated core domain-containing protein [Bacteroidota bacterium]